MARLGSRPTKMGGPSGLSASDVREAPWQQTTPLAGPLGQDEGLLLSFFFQPEWANTGTSATPNEFAQELVVKQKGRRPSESG